jgi:hypothetical protein
LPESASEQEVCQAVLNALSPISEELDQWKSAVFSSNNLGAKYFKEHLFYTPVRVVRDASDLLLLRSLCTWHLGNTDSSDIRCVLKSSDLLYDYGHTFISLSVAIALDLTTSSTIYTIIHGPGITSEKSKQLVSLMPTFDAKTAINSALQTEYIVQVSYLTSLAGNTKHPLSGNEEPLRDEPIYLLEEARADIAEFQFDTYFDPRSVTIKSTLAQKSDIIFSRIASSGYGEISKELLYSLSIGIDYYLSNALKAQLQLDSAKLSTYVTLYHGKHGHFPENLNLLIPEFLSKLPPPTHRLRFQLHQTHNNRRSPHH